MARTLPLLVAAACVIAAACALASSAPASGRAEATRAGGAGGVGSGNGAAARTLLNYGDSLAVGTGLFLRRALPGWTVRDDTDVSRHADDAPGDLRAYGRALPRVILVSAGANDAPGAVPWFTRQVRQVLRVAGPGRCVIWSTVLRPPYEGVPYDGLNAALRRIDRSSAPLRVFDWAGLAREHPGWFGPDGVHPTMTGYRARAAALGRLARVC